LSTGNRSNQNKERTILLSSSFRPAIKQAGRQSEGDNAPISYTLAKRGRLDPRWPYRGLGCEVCRRRGPVDLIAIERARGPAFTLANRRPRCPCDGCPGRVAFMDMSGSWPKPIDTIGDRDAAWWEYTDQRRAELMALGWRVVMGKWVAPPH
jgi:hypothetical protein